MQLPATQRSQGMLAPETTTSSSSSSTRSMQLIAALLIASFAIPRLWAAWFDQGIFWPDEIFQSTEQAHRLVFGYGVTPWEFRAGARSWVFPGMIAVVFKAASLVGIDSGQALVLIIKTCMAGASMVALYLSVRLANQLAGPRAAVLAAVFAGAFPVSILLSARSLSETATAPVLLGSYMLARGTGPRRQLMAGALAGLAIAMRYQSGVIACGLFAIVLSERRWKDALWFAAGASTLGLMSGLLDWFTWGQPFGALKKYLYFNLKKSGAKFGRYPFTYYATVTWSAVGPAALVIVAGLLASARVVPKLVLLVLGYVLLHSLIPHKEYRFLMPVVPLALALAAVGVVEILRELRAPALVMPVIALTCGAAMLYSTTQLTWEKLGFPSDRGARSPWHSGEGINRLLWAAGESSDVCGVMVSGESFGWIGGYTYFHRDASLLGATGEAEQRAANYLIAPAAAPLLAGYAPVASSRDSVLAKRTGGCEKPENNFRDLPY